MLTDLLSHVVGQARAQDLLHVLAVDERLEPAQGDTVPLPVLAGGLHFLLFEGLLNRSSSAVTIAGEAIERGEKLRLDHVGLAILDAPYVGGVCGRGRHHLGYILEPLGYVQTESHSLLEARATAHVYRFNALPAIVPDFVIIEVHALRFNQSFQGAAHSVFANAPLPGHVRVQTALRKLANAQGLNRDEAAEFLQNAFAWFGRQHVPPRKADYDVLIKSSPIAAWIAHEGQNLSHASVRVSHLSATMDAQLREGRELQPMKTSLDQSIKLAGLVPDIGPRPFREASQRVIHESVPIAHLSFIERGELPAQTRFDPGLF